MIKFDAGKKSFRKLVSSFFVPTPRLTLSDWCKKNLMLPPTKNQAEPGEISFEGREFLIEPLDEFLSPDTQDLVIVGPTRGGKTFILHVICAYCISVWKTSIIIIDQTERKLRKLLKTELHPLIKYNRFLRDLMPDDKKQFGLETMLMKGSEITALAAQSPNSLAGDSAQVVLGNEANRWRGEGEEAAAIALARHRTESFKDRRRHVFTGTPTTESCDIIEELKKTNYKVYMPRCVKCNEHGRYTFQNLFWDQEAKDEDGNWDYKRVRSSTKLKCPKCGYMMSEEERQAAVKNGKYFATNPSPKTSFKGYSFNGIDTRTTRTLGHLAEAFLSAKRDGMYVSLRDFFNSEMGEAMKDDITELSVEKLSSLIKKGQERGTLPVEIETPWVIMTVDVQVAHLWWAVWAYDFKNNRRAIVDHGQAPGFEDLISIQDNYKCKYVAIDTNFEARAPETLQFILKYETKGWIGIEGFDTMIGSIKVEPRDAFLGTARAGRHMVKVMRISNFEFKLNVEKMLSGELAGFIIYDPEVSDNGGQSLNNFLTQLLNERRVRVKGHKEPVFKAKGDNHAFDLFTYAEALAKYKRSTMAAIPGARQGAKKNKKGGLSFKK